MRRLAIGAALVAGVAFAARELAPKLHERMLAKCQRMFEHMPEDFPPKKITVGVEEIRANTTRMLELLEERAQAEEAKPPEEPLWSATEEVELVHA
jgi:hypothetical protein